ncbi:MAG: M23 family metallopeptidase [Actinobacteria bacterium]|nr:M23 family metallopeptidase [Actinomycetota bacterium]
MDGGDATGTLAPRAGADLGSIPGVGGVAVRVDQRSVRVNPPRRSVRRVRPAVAGLVALILLPAAYAATIGSRSGADAASGDIAVRSLDQPAGDVAPDAPAAGAVAAIATASVDAPPVFARFDDLPLHLPSDEVELVGFHEAAYDDALEMAPRGRIAMNENTTKFRAPAADDDGPPYLVLSSRGRVHPATSAVDVVLRDGVAVLSVVTGTVTDVRPYALYGKYPDTRIEIRPADRPDLRVVLIHVDGVRVGVGDEVVAGETVLAETANRFPFPSHIDRYSEPDRWPHVHLEVKRTG